LEKATAPWFHFALPPYRPGPHLIEPRRLPMLLGYHWQEMFQHVLPEPAATIVAAAAYTGVRRGELRGFLWENYDGEQVAISQSFWRSHALEPKTRKSRASIRVIKQLAEKLELHRSLARNPANGLMFPSAQGKPINLDALVRDVIVPVFNGAKLQWRGWHAFRRGLATNLHHLGVDDKTIQRILRHASVAVTQNCYIKTVDAETTAAMQHLERSLEYAPNMHLAGAQRPRINVMGI
jgi:integrase